MGEFEKLGKVKKIIWIIEITVEKTKSDEHTEWMEKERRALAELIQEKSSEHDQKLEAMQNALSNDRK